ncbi:hypothetical protein J437_LFUL017878, partial [Ladona fulva]
LQKDILKHKENYYINIPKTYRKDLSKPWQFLNNIKGKGAYHSKEIAEEFSSLFLQSNDLNNTVSLGNIHNIASDYSLYFSNYYSQKSLYFTPANEVMRIMNGLLKTCSPRGIDGVSNHVVKVIHDSIAPIFTF